MQVTQTLKVDQLILPGAIVNSGSWTSQAIDMTGAHEALVTFNLGALDAAITALKLQECDTSGGSYTDISGADYSATGNVLPTASDDNKIWAWYVSYRGGRKAFLKIVATIGTGSTGGYATATVVHGRIEQAPYDATTAGAAQLLTIS